MHFAKFSFAMHSVWCYNAAGMSLLSHVHCTKLLVWRWSSQSSFFGKACMSGHGSFWLCWSWPGTETSMIRWVELTAFDTAQLFGTKPKVPTYAEYGPCTLSVNNLDLAIQGRWTLSMPWLGFAFTAGTTHCTGAIAILIWLWFST